MFDQVGVGNGRRVECRAIGQIACARWILRCRFRQIAVFPLNPCCYSSPVGGIYFVGKNDGDAIAILVPHYLISVNAFAHQIGDAGTHERSLFEFFL